MPAQAAGPGTGNWPVGVGPHLAGGGRAHHGLVGRRELGGVEQGGAVDGDAVYKVPNGEEAKSRWRPLERQNRGTSLLG